GAVAPTGDGAAPGGAGGEWDGERPPRVDRRPRRPPRHQRRHSPGAGQPGDHLRLDRVASPGRRARAAAAFGPSTHGSTARLVKEDLDTMTPEEKLRLDLQRYWLIKHVLSCD